MERHRPGHVGVDEPLEPNKIVAGGDLPLRGLRVQTPACEMAGFEFQRMERQTKRAFTLKADALAAKQLGVSLPSAPIVTLDIDDVPSPDPAGFARAWWLHLLASRPVHGEAMRNCRVTRLQDGSAPASISGDVCGESTIALQKLASTIGPCSSNLPEAANRMRPHH